eukprot:1158471-Amorphochlora_amoeboformis.AAC.2
MLRPRGRWGGLWWTWRGLGGPVPKAVPRVSATVARQHFGLAETLGASSDGQTPLWLPWAPVPRSSPRGALEEL